MEGILDMLFTVRWSGFYNLIFPYVGSYAFVEYVKKMVRKLVG
jgi:hypothetical protein